MIINEGYWLTQRRWIPIPSGHSEILQSVDVKRHALLPPFEPIPTFDFALQLWLRGGDGDTSVNVTPYESERPQDV